MIKFLDLKKINEPHEVAFTEKFKQLLNSGWYILGSEVEIFEKNYAKFCNSNHCIGVGNGLDALILIFKAHLALGNLQKNDEVIVPANTYIASVLAILEVGLVPVFIEPNIDTFNIDVFKIQDKVTPKTKAILVVNLYGQLAQQDEINKIAIKNNLFIVEDAAQSHGAVGNFMNTENHEILRWSAAAYSFYPSKNLGALGDAGAVTTNNFILAKTISMLRNYGSEQKYYNEIIGVNSRLDEIQASFLNVKLPFLAAENNRRREIASRYLAEIKNKKLKLPYWDKSENHVFHLFVILVDDRNVFMNFMTENQIETNIHYPVAPHKQNALKNFNNLHFPITEKIHAHCVSLPLNPILTNDQVSKIINAINSY